MSLRSMTGFAVANGRVDGTDWRWDLRTLNGRGLDVRIRLPQGFEDIEQKTREMVSGTVGRGNCQAGLQVRSADGSVDMVVNEAMLRRVAGIVEQVRAETGASAPTADGILALKGVLDVTDEEPEDVRAARRAAIMDGLGKALSELGEARSREGAELERTVLAQVDSIERLVQEIADLPARSSDAQFARLQEQMDRLLGTGADLSGERLYQEAALIATKADIREELDRLTAHVDAARSLVALQEPVGRRLDFLAQEFNREANTICSKSNDIETTRRGLDLKAAIDQFREQVQNIE